MNPSSPPDFSKWVPGFDFLQKLAATPTQSAPSASAWVAPTLDPKELEKRIQDLRTVKFWLEQNTQAVAATKPEVVTYGVTQEQATRYGLPCGGTLQLVLEPVGENSHLDQLLAAIERHELVARTLNMDSGIANIQPGRWSDVLEFDGKALKTVHGPRWRLLVIGAGQVSRYLAQMAQALDYHVTVCDPREEYYNGWDLPSVPLDRRYPDDAAIAMNMDAHCAVVALTHDPKLDDLALMEALKSEAFSLPTPQLPRTKPPDVWAGTHIQDPFLRSAILGTAGYLLRRTIRIKALRLLNEIRNEAG